MFQIIKAQKPRLPKNKDLKNQAIDKQIKTRATYSITKIILPPEK
jgi:hypothetical protein